MQRQRDFKEDTRFRNLQWALTLIYGGQAIAYIVLAAENESKYVPIYLSYFKWIGGSAFFLETSKVANIKILWCGVAVLLMSFLISLILSCLTRYDFQHKRRALLIGRAIVDAFIYTLVGFQAGVLIVQLSLAMAGLAFAKVYVLTSFFRGNPKFDDQAALRMLIARSGEDPEIHEKAVKGCETAISDALIKGGVRPGVAQRIEQQLDIGRRRQYLPNQWEFENFNIPFMSTICGIFLWVLLFLTLGYYWNSGTDSNGTVHVQPYVFIIFFLCFVFWVIFLLATWVDYFMVLSEFLQLLFYEMIFLLSITLIAWLGLVEVLAHSVQLSGITVSPTGLPP